MTCILVVNLFAVKHWSSNGRTSYQAQIDAGLCCLMAVPLSHSSVLQLLQPERRMSNFLFSEHFKVQWMNRRLTMKTWNFFVGTHCVRVCTHGMECATSRYFQQMAGLIIEEFKLGIFVQLYNYPTANFFLKFWKHFEGDTEQFCL